MPGLWNLPDDEVEVEGFVLDFGHQVLVHSVELLLAERTDEVQVEFDSVGCVPGSDDVQVAVEHGVFELSMT